jgi:hypothetical protein
MPYRNTYIERRTRSTYAYLSELRPTNSITKYFKSKYDVSPQTMRTILMCSNV